MGREIFIPDRDGKVYPVGRGMGGGGSSISYADQRRINITPANGVTPAQMTAALSAYDRQSRRNLTAALQTAGARY
jgi:hypothetical protein